MTSPPQSMCTVVCTSKTEALSQLQAAHEHGRPLLLRDFWPHFHSRSLLQQSLPDTLRHCVSPKSSVVVYCQHEPGAFPHCRMDEVSFHEFLAEWEKRREEEKEKAQTSSGDGLDVGTTKDTSPFDSHADIFLGNALIEQLSPQLLEMVGESPFASMVALQEELKGEPSSSSSSSSSSAPPTHSSSHTHNSSPTHNYAVYPQSTERGRLWIGNAGHVSHLHFDAHHGLLVALSGHKRVTLYEPLSHMGVIHKSTEGNHALENPVKCPLPCPPSCPTLQSLSSEPIPNASNPIEKSSEPSPHSSTPVQLCVSLSPGDALFIPLYWWHLVESVSSSIALNFWHYPDLRASLSKFTTLWPFTRALLLDHLRVLCRAPTSSPGLLPSSRLALLASSSTNAILDALLRFKLEPTLLLSPHLVHIAEHAWTWASLHQEASSLIRQTIATPHP